MTFTADQRPLTSKKPSMPLWECGLERNVAGKPKYTVMLSSTYKELGEHREAAQHAILGHQLFPVAMENDSALSNHDLISASLGQVDEADAYVGLISYRYGQTPECSVRNSNKLSLTELEFRRAVDRKIPICMFIMHEDHLVPMRAVFEEKDAERQKRVAFTALAKKDRIYAEFKSVDDLKAKVVQSLVNLREAIEKRTTSSLFKHAVPAVKRVGEPSKGAEWAVSYAWGDITDIGREREALVDQFCAQAKARGITIIRDKTAMRLGDRISKFMERIGRSDRVFIFLSDRYLKSAFCMYELFEVWRNCRQDDEEFAQRTRVYLLPCANIGSFKERAEYVRWWRERFADMQKVVAGVGFDALAQADLADFRRMQDFAGRTPDMLRLVLDVLSPRSFGDFTEHGLN